MKINIVIDNRETKLLPLVKKLIESEPQKFEHISLKIEQLEIADIQIKDEEDNILLMIERKSISDLASSILDGRYNEQSFRLDKTLVPNHNIYYLIEGSIKNYKNFNKKINSNTIYSSIFTLSYYKGFSVFKTEDILETACFITRITDKLYRENKTTFKPSFYSLNNDIHKESKEYSDIIKTEKKSFIHKDNIAKIMLMQIPSVSSNSASIITNKYKTIIDLICALQDDINCLENLKYITSNGKERKINKSCIKNIKDFLLNQD